MKPIFSIVVLLVVLAIVGLVAKKQLQAYKAVPPGISAAGVDVPTGSPAQIEQQVKQDVERSLQQGAARASDAEQ